MVITPVRKLPAVMALAVAFIFFIAACSRASGSPSTSPLTGETYPLNPLFSEFYESLGGFELLGPAITPIFLQANLQMQYTESALLVYDPLAIPNFFLAPLGLDLGYAASSSTVSNRYTVFSGFLDLYNRLGGEKVVGPPLGEAELNTEKNRIEQHFVNLGLYQSLDDPARRTYLLAYGVLACSKDCAYNPPDSAIIDNGIRLQEPFAAAAASLGSEFTGLPLAGPHLAADGSLEVIFENLVMFTDPEDPSTAEIRPIVEQIGFQPHPLSERMNTDKVVFYIVRDGLGYNIPATFSNFLSRYGNLSVSGPPISELFQLETDVFRQCFTNICLDYYISRDPEERVQLAPLGSIYKAYTLPSGAASQGMRVPEMSVDYQLRVWEAAPYITSQQEQTIYVSVFQDSSPSTAVETSLSVTFPDGTVVKYRLQPTNAEGLSSILIPPIPAPNGTMIYYEVCAGEGARPICVQDNFLIWGNP